MKERPEDEDKIRRYLMNSLSPEELEETEQRLLADSRYLERVSLIEEELVDSYVCKGMPPEERRQFEESYLATPDGQEQVRLAVRLKQYALAASAARVTKLPAEHISPRNRPLFEYLLPTPPARRAVFATFAVLSVVLAISAVVALWRLSSEDARPASDDPNVSELRNRLSEQQRQNEELSAKLRSEQDQRSAAERDLIELERTKAKQLLASLMNVVLTPGRERGNAGGSRLKIAPGVRRIALYLELRQTVYDRFKASVQDENGREVRVGESPAVPGARRRKRAKITVPASLLSDGDYVVKLYGMKDGAEPAEIDYYYFRVAPR